MTNIKDIIIRLKEVRNERGLSYTDIVNLVEANGDYISKSTVARLFSEGSEDLSFRYDETIRPVADALLDIENLEDDDTMDVKAMKVIVRYKTQVIEGLRDQIEKMSSDFDRERVSFYERLEAEREHSQKSIDFLKEQVALKDKRMDLLLETFVGKKNED